MSLIIGLTGGIGCGKSTVANLFARYGAGIVDTDVISHQLTQKNGAAIPAIRATFGDGYIAEDGAMDRNKMRALVFSDAAVRQRLEHILHPMILEQAEQQLRQLQSDPYCILVVPLLSEHSIFRRLMQRVLVVDCDERTQTERVTARSNMSERDVRAIISSQLSRAERLQLADDVIHNDAGPDSLAKQVAALHQRYGQNNN